MAAGFLEFAVEQKTFDIGGTCVGGQPGVRPVVLIGTIFYHGQKIVTNEEKGEFRRDDAERLIRAQEDFSERTGNPCMFDVVGSTPEAIARHLEFVAGITQAPLLIDGTTADVRIAGLKYAADAGLCDRIVYNSIIPDVTDEELRAIQDAGVTSAILLTYYLLDFTAKGRVESVRQLLPRCLDAGVEKLLVDTCVLDLATFGQACNAIVDIKNEFGLPAGGGVHNAVALWRGLKKKMGPQAQAPCLASASAAAAAVGADFALYGPVEDAQYVFPAVAMIDTAYSQVVMERDQKPVEGHPRYRIG